MVEGRSESVLSARPLEAGVAAGLVEALAVFDGPAIGVGSADRF